MNYWIEADNYDFKKGISLLQHDDPYGRVRILNVRFEGDDVVFEEGCDEEFKTKMSKEAALQAIAELQQWVRRSGPVKIKCKGCP